MRPLRRIIINKGLQNAHLSCALEGPIDRRPRIPSLTNNVNQRPALEMPLDAAPSRRGGGLYAHSFRTVNALARRFKNFFPAATG